ETETYKALRSLGLEAEMLDSSAVAGRFPQFNPEAFAFGVYDPNGAILHAERAVRAALELARQRGVVLMEGRRVIGVERSEGSRVRIVIEAGGTCECNCAVIASGPWTRKLLPCLGSKLTTTRQETVYFEPARAVASSFGAGDFPTFIELESGFYGFPVHHRGWMKIANHHRGATADPYEVSKAVDEDFIESCRVFFRRFIPELADAQVRETRVCLYNNTPDDDFLIDWHPEIENVLIVTGFSGHGFKFGSVIGRIAAGLLRERRTSYNIERFSLGRLAER
ncbi:MAG TPA: FAD-dependent oxidoreductase, partial [Blastocatellia bacterium]|nr:FAD-dependent oxidoreductase [Blastocatellia bacterium]